MASTPKVLVEGQDIPSSATAIYSVSSSVNGVYLDKINTLNYSGSAVTVTVWLVPSGGQTDARKQIVLSLSAGATYSYPELAGAFVGGGGIIYAQCSAATSANIRISGREIT